MKPVYINSAACISAQPTLEPNFFDELKADLSQNIIYALQPSYKDFIPPAQIRRMSKVVKMSTVASKKALEEAQLEMPDAIIVGTGMGCTEDSEKFLRNVIQNDEDFLTPTNFIQSTHNTVAGQIALGIGCHAYNFTYVNSGSSLEFSLLDAKLQLQFEDKKAILVGVADETAQRTAELYQLAGFIKNQSEFPINILNSDSKGSFWGEGTAFFVLESEKKDSTYAELTDISIINSVEVQKLNGFCNDFLSKNRINPCEIDAVMLGFSGDKTADEYHKTLQQNFPDAAQLYYKHLSGDFNTAGGFGLFMALKILKNQSIPQIMNINQKEKSEIKTVLLYNNFMGKDHSFMLLKRA